jgi:glycosyltransferase involved in cell wall biosynthesis
MNILFCSVPFRPSLGGIETVSAILAEQFHLRGHAVTLVTQTASVRADAEPYPVVRQPTAAQLWALVRDADVVFHNNISLRLAWPLLLLRRPWVVAHHTWTPRHGVGRLKRWLLPHARNISVSRALADDLPLRSAVLPNPYRADLFRPLAGIARSRDVIFVGRLASEKGVALLLDALRLLREQGFALTATIVGDGPEAPALLAQAERTGLSAQVDFRGACGGEELVRRLHGHRVFAMPTLGEETFGVAVLEALACGCVPVVADSGGLADTVGPCGRIFAKGDARALAAELLRLRENPRCAERLLVPAAEHLSRHRPERVAAGYLRVIEDACRRSRPAFAA